MVMNKLLHVNNKVGWELKINREGQCQAIKNLGRQHTAQNTAICVAYLSVQVALVHVMFHVAHSERPSSGPKRGEEQS